MKKLLTILLCVALSVVSVFAITGCKKDAIVCHTNAFFAPFEYYQGTEIVGVDVEIMNKVADKMGKDLIIEDKDFSTLIDSTSDGTLCDCAAAGITITDARKEKVNFSIPYYTSVQYVVFAKDTITVSKNANNEDVVLWESLAGKKIGVQLDTTGDIYVGLEIEGEEDYEGALQGKNAEKKPYDTAQLAFDSLKAGTGAIDVVVVDKLPAQYLIKNDTANYVALPLYYDANTATEEQYAIAVNKNQTDLLNAINEVLTELLNQQDAQGQNGIEQLVMKHFAI
ncbi:MAG: amino acid ABC transporter substrate-binding protein [Clostridiales bacterium]|nr:amino acid ABC transporter substrate-binding protein [Clostridiales bacterium]